MNIMDSMNSMNIVSDIDALEQLYSAASERSVSKVATVITPLYRQWIEASRFLVLATMSDEGCDASPRGDSECPVAMPDSQTILLPDWRGNNRLDSIRNIVNDGRVSLMFMIAGCDNVVRVIGKAVVSNDETLVNRFQRGNKTPTTVIVIKVGEVYFQCAKSLMRSDLWNSKNPGTDVPTAGDFLKEQQSDFDGSTYDSEYPAYAKDKFW